jgi:hypothetical protein
MGHPSRVIPKDAIPGDSSSATGEEEELLEEEEVVVLAPAPRWRIVVKRTWAAAKELSILEDTIAPKYIM